ncbi:MAG TPA: class I SAM-dependent methyltransferase [Acidobacteriota bacterium]
MALSGARRWWRRPKLERLAPRAAFERLAAGYDAQDNPLWVLERPELAALLPTDLSGLDAADLGGGTGHWGAELLRRGARRVVVIDLALAMLRAGCAARSGLGWAQADLLRLPLRSERFDLAVAGCCLSYVERLDRALLECARILRRGGALLISDYHPSGMRPGWTRGFACGGRTIVPHTWEHGPERIAGAARAAGLELDTLREVAADDRLQRFDRESRGLEPLSAIRGLPVLLVVRLLRQ